MHEKSIACASNGRKSLKQSHSLSKRSIEKISYNDLILIPVLVHIKMSCVLFDDVTATIKAFFQHPQTITVDGLHILLLRLNVIISPSTLLFWCFKPISVTYISISSSLFFKYLSYFLIFVFVIRANRCHFVCVGRANSLFFWLFSSLILFFFSLW